MRRIAHLVLASCLVGLPLASKVCAGEQKREGVFVRIEVIDAQQAEDIFDADMLGHKVQPLMVEIRNGSQQTYQFSKANVGAKQIPAETAARAAYENPIVVTGGIVGRVLSIIPRNVLPHRERHDVSRPLLNRQIQASVVKEQIPDATVAPNGSLTGLMYVRPLGSNAKLRVTLINTQTNEPLVFDVPLS